MQKRKIIISSIKKMNLSMLEVLLSDHYTFMNASKDTFLSKLNFVFKRYKDEGDTELKFVKRQNKKAKNILGEETVDHVLIRWIGNNTKRYTDITLVFEGDELTDVKENTRYKNTLTREGLGNAIPILIYKDEEVDFEPSDEYFRLAGICENALDELDQFKGLIINRDVYLEWLDKYNELGEMISFMIVSEFSAFRRFYFLYHTLKDFAKYLLHEQEAMNALGLFAKVPNTKLGRKEWLQNHMSLGLNLKLLVRTKTPYVEPLHENSYLETRGLKVSLFDFVHLIDFLNLFEKEYNSVLHTSNKKLSYNLSKADEKILQDSSLIS